MKYVWCLEMQSEDGYFIDLFSSEKKMNKKVAEIKKEFQGDKKCEISSTDESFAVTESSSGNFIMNVQYGRKYIQ